MTAILEPSAPAPAQAPAPASAPAPPAPAPAPPAPVRAAVPVRWPADDAPAPVRTAPARPADRVLRAYGAAMGALFVLAVAVQPVTDAVPAWWAVVLSQLAFFGMLTTVAGGLMARGWSVRAGLLSSVTLLGLSVSCPVSGHHEYAAWWGIQVAAGIAMTALSAHLHRRSRR
jgi:hypothetical protein